MDKKKCENRTAEDEKEVKEEPKKKTVNVSAFDCSVSVHVHSCVSMVSKMRFMCVKTGKVLFVFYLSMY